MKILIIFTGGTIGSSAHDNIISIDGEKPYKLLEMYNDKYGIDFEYDTLNPYTALSENNSGIEIFSLIAAVKEGIPFYDGVIVTHGTDTLQYSAAALSYCLGRGCVPVCLVSANYPLEDDRSNGLYNFKAAIDLIRESCSDNPDGEIRSYLEKRGMTLGGVFVPYKNGKDDRAIIHRGSRLLAHNAFSDELYSLNDGAEVKDEVLPFSPITFSEVADSVVRIDPYPGMLYPEIPDWTKYIVHGSYHSGTINTESENSRDFFEEMRERDIKVFLTGVTKGTAYESTAMFEEWGIIPAYDIAPIAAYLKVWLADSSGIDAETVIARSLGGDILKR